MAENQRALAKVDHNSKWRSSNRCYWCY